MYKRKGYKFAAVENVHLLVAGLGDVKTARLDQDSSLLIENTRKLKDWRAYDEVSVEKSKMFSD